MIIDVENLKQINLKDELFELSIEHVGKLFDKMNDEDIKKYLYITNEDFQTRYDRLNNEKQALVLNTFSGYIFRLANFWFEHIPIPKGPIKYLEVGILYGANALSVAQTYAKDENSEIHCVDPWIEYREDDGLVSYNDMNNIYETFMTNVELSGYKNKFRIYKEYSHKKVPTFEDNSFDIIYIDGGHGQINVLEDAIMCFRKLKKGGYLILDDVNWLKTTRSMIYFINTYELYIDIDNVYFDNCQLFIKKIKRLE